MATDRGPPHYPPSTGYYPPSPRRPPAPAPLAQHARRHPREVWWRGKFDWEYKRRMPPSPVGANERSPGRSPANKVPAPRLYKQDVLEQDRSEFVLTTSGTA
jgi:hypothetical protein